jgi:hypothetical protein
MKAARARREIEVALDPHEAKRYPHRVDTELAGASAAAALASRGPLRRTGAMTGAAPLTATSALL